MQQCNSQLEQCWAAERIRCLLSLSHKDIMALAGLWYRQMWLPTMRLTQVMRRIGRSTEDLLMRGLVYFDPDSDGDSKRALQSKKGRGSATHPPRCPHRADAGKARGLECG